MGYGNLIFKRINFTILLHLRFEILLKMIFFHVAILFNRFKLKMFSKNPTERSYPIIISISKSCTNICRGFLQVEGRIIRKIPKLIN